MLLNISWLYRCFDCQYGQDGESFKKNARALGCNMVDFKKPHRLPGSAAAAYDDAQSAKTRPDVK